MRSCAASIHDLSRVQLSQGYPRFNMPFEAGLATALSMTRGARHERFILEERGHRLQRSLSDLNGTDPYIHRGTPRGILEAVSDIFDRPAFQLRVRELDKLYRDLSEFARRLGPERGRDLFRRGPFLALVYAAQKLARGRRFIPPARRSRRRRRRQARAGRV